MSELPKIPEAIKVGAAVPDQYISIEGGVAGSEQGFLPVLHITIVSHGEICKSAEEALNDLKAVSPVVGRILMDMFSMQAADTFLVDEKGTPHKLFQRSDVSG